MRGVSRPGAYSNFARLWDGGPAEGLATEEKQWTIGRGSVAGGRLALVRAIGHLAGDSGFRGVIFAGSSCAPRVLPELKG